MYYDEDTLPERSEARQSTAKHGKARVRCRGELIYVLYKDTIANKKRKIFIYKTKL